MTGQDDALKVEKIYSLEFAVKSADLPFNIERSVRRLSSDPHRVVHDFLIELGGMLKEIQSVASSESRRPDGDGQDVSRLFADHSVALEFVREVASLPCKCSSHQGRLPCLHCRAATWLHSETQGRQDTVETSSIVMERCDMSPELKQTIRENLALGKQLAAEEAAGSTPADSLPVSLETMKEAHERAERAAVPDHALETADKWLDGTICECGHERRDHQPYSWACSSPECNDTERHCEVFRPVTFEVRRAERQDARPATKRGGV